MIVGIVPTGVGLVPVNNQWRKADDVAAGRDQYVNAYTPPRDPANFIAFDSEFENDTVVKPAVGKEWSYDRTAAVLSQTDLSPVIPPTGDDWQQPVENVLDIPPVGPANGVRYLVGTEPSGAWVGFEDHIAQWDTSWNRWRFVVPVDGFFVFLLSPGALWMYDGTSWAPYPTVGSDTDDQESHGTPTAPYKFKSFTTKALRAGKYKIVVTMKSRLDKSNREGDLMVLLDDDPEKVLLATGVSGTKWKTYSEETEVELTGATAVHTVDFYYSSPFKKSSIYAKNPSYRIKRG